MKRTITTTAVLICLMAHLSRAAMADDENASSEAKSPLMLNYFPTKGVLISDTGYTEIESEITFTSSTRTNTLRNIEQRFRYGISDRTEVSVTQGYVIGSDTSRSGFGRYYLEIGEFDNPTFGLEHRLDISDSKHIYAVGLNIRPEVPYSKYAPNFKEQAVFGKFNWQVADDLWLGILGKYTNSYTKFFDRSTEAVELQFGASKNWAKSSIFLGLNLSQVLDFSVKKYFNSPNLIDRYESKISPKIIGGISYKIHRGAFAIIDYSLQSLKREVTTFFQGEYQFSSTSTTTTQTITARLVKEF
jgi:hypothetical protein